MPTANTNRGREERDHYIRSSGGSSRKHRKKGCYGIVLVLRDLPECLSCIEVCCGEWAECSLSGWRCFLLLIWFRSVAKKRFACVGLRLCCPASPYPILPLSIRVSLYYWSEKQALFYKPSRRFVALLTVFNLYLCAYLPPGNPRLLTAHS